MCEYVCMCVCLLSVCVCDRVYLYLCVYACVHMSAECIYVLYYVLHMFSQVRRGL